MTNLRYWHDGCHDTLQTLELDGDGNLVEVGCDPSRAEAAPDVSGDGAANGGRARTATRARAG